METETVYTVHINLIKMHIPSDMLLDAVSIFKSVLESTSRSFMCIKINFTDPYHPVVYFMDRGEAEVFERSMTNPMTFTEWMAEQN